MDCRLVYLKEHKEKKSHVNVYLDNGTMLDGSVVSYDEDSLVLNKCLINWDKVISIKPRN